MLKIHSATQTKHLNMKTSVHPNNIEQNNANKHITKKGSISLFNKR